MKYFKNIIFTILLLSIFVFNLAATVFNIKNDNQEKIIIVDPNKNHAIIVGPDEIGTIDTTIKGIREWFVTERLNFYVWNPKSNQFEKKYRFIQNYSEQTDNDLTFTQIKDFVLKPTDRYNAVEFVTEKL